MGNVKTYAMQTPLLKPFVLLWYNSIVPCSTTWKHKLLVDKVYLFSFEPT
jgi:hypothetical protein